MVWRIGVDIGGTFTDVAVVEEKSGRIGVAKVPTTPGDLAEGVLHALASAMSRYDVVPDQVGLLSHATTVVTNAILEDKGARAALITTRGFRDVLELRRSARANLYDLFQDAPATLIPRRRRFEISERIGADGDIVTPLADRDVDELIAALKTARVDSIAVSLLFSFLNPVHERRLGARLRAALPDVPVYLSSDVLPEIKEFERTSTTAVCAYVGPILSSYLGATGKGYARSKAAPALSDGIERRHSRSGRGHCHAGHGGRIGSGCRRCRGGARGAANRAPKPALVRHGRHDRQGKPDSTRPVRHHAGLRGRRRIEHDAVDQRHRSSDSPASHRSRRSLCRRRIDCMDRSGRRATRWSQERGRRSWPRLLRARRHRADRYRLQPTCSAISTRNRCSAATFRSIMRQRQKRVRFAARRDLWASISAQPRRLSSTSLIMRWLRLSKSSPSNAATIRAILCSPLSAERARCTPPRSQANSALPR